MSNEGKCSSNVQLAGGEEGEANYRSTQAKGEAKCRSKAASNFTYNSAAGAAASAVPAAQFLVLGRAGV
eukprot:2649728-Pleurochrysis_carterae.AAC.1